MVSEHDCQACSEAIFESNTASPKHLNYQGLHGGANIISTLNHFTLFEEYGVSVEEKMHFLQIVHKNGNVRKNS